MIYIYTDGASSGNPGPGGYGVVLIYEQHRKELSEGFRLTTNNRMELLAVITGLEAIKGTGKQVMVVSDSKYVIEPVTLGWVFNWQRKRFKGKKNVDLWQRFLLVYPKHKIQFKWVKGHAGHKENERCDEMAVEAAAGQDLKVDIGYEDSIK